MKKIFEKLLNAGVLRPLDFELARHLCTNENEEVFCLCVLLSVLRSRGILYLKLADTAGRALADFFKLEEFDSDIIRETMDIKIPEKDILVDALNKAFCVGSSIGDDKPLILEDNERLYLYRDLCDELELAATVNSRTSRHEQPDSSIPDKFLSLVGNDEKQRQAVEGALHSNLSIITGGPGTGKTSIVCAIAAIFAEIYPDARMMFAAPSGKAAARLRESITAGLERLKTEPHIKEKIIGSAIETVHRLLGASLNLERPFKYGRQRKLPADLLVIDEASMLPLELFARIFAAADDHCKIVLLGDADQLPPVESGAVFTDLSKSTIAGLVNRLETSHRFSSEHNIGKFAAAVRQGDCPAASALANDNNDDSVKIQELPHSRRQLRERLMEFVFNYDTDIPIAERFANFYRHGILCAMRQGDYGLETVNDIFSSLFNVRSPQSLYDSCPVMIRHNCPRTGLRNGDIGIAIDDGSALKVYFRDNETQNSFRHLPVALLPEYEKAYAMSVHKSQGSEFENVLMILPQYFSPVLSRELIYTAVTRARKSLTIWADPDILSRSIQTLKPSSTTILRRLKKPEL